MVRSARLDRRGIAAVAMCTVLALSGCSGGAVSVRSNFSGPPLGSAPPVVPATPATNAPRGFYAAGDGDVMLAILVALMLFDGVSWASQRIRQAFGDSDAPPEASPAASTDEPVRRVPRTGASWVFSLP